MQVQSLKSVSSLDLRDLGKIAFISAGVLFGAGVLLFFVARGDAFLGRQLPLVLMTLGVIDGCFAAALWSHGQPQAERTRLRALAIVGSVVAIIAVTAATAYTRLGAFDFIIMVVAVGGTLGLYRLGETYAAKHQALAAPAKPAAPAEPAAAAEDKPASPAG